jgi:hypothetical protein
MVKHFDDFGGLFWRQRMGPAAEAGRKAAEPGRASHALDCPAHHREVRVAVPIDQQRRLIELERHVPRPPLNHRSVRAIDRSYGRGQVDKPECVGAPWMNPSLAPSRRPNATSLAWQPVQPKLPYSQNGSSLPSVGPRGRRRWMRTTETLNCFSSTELLPVDPAILGSATARQSEEDERCAG